MRSRIAWVIVGVLSTAGLVIAVAQDRAVEEYMNLQGAWIISAAEQNGKPLDVMKGGVLTITDRSFALKTATGKELTGELRLNPAASPKQLDFVHSGGTPVWEAVYTADPDVFQLNYIEAGPRARRPTAGTAGTVVVMRRAAK